MEHLHVQINADDYFDAADAAGTLDQANDGTWDACLGLEFMVAHSTSETLTFRVINHKKFVLAELKHGFKGTHIQLPCE